MAWISDHSAARWQCEGKSRFTGHRQDSSTADSIFNIKITDISYALSQNIHHRNVPQVSIRVSAQSHVMVSDGKGSMNDFMRSSFLLLAVQSAPRPIIFQNDNATTNEM